MKEANPTETVRNDKESILVNLMLFCELLHRMGLKVGSGNIIDLVRSTEDIPISSKQDFRNAARSLLVHNKADFPLFDEAFQIFWRKPSANQTTQDIRSMGEQRRYKAPQISPSDQEINPDPPNTNPEGNNAQPAIEISRTFSPNDVLRNKDFANFTISEISQAKTMISDLTWNPGRQLSRRKTPGNGSLIDFPKTFRSNINKGGELFDIAHRTNKLKPRPLILICDVSGSMERYTRMLLHFTHSIAGEVKDLEAFLFATRLTRITRKLSFRSVDQAVDEVSKVVLDWSGGTRIGETLRSFNLKWSRRMRTNKSVVMIISDGWDRGEPDLLATEIARLQRSCYRLIWLNPLLGAPDFEPLTRGLQAALPYVDDFLPIHNLNSLETLANYLSEIGPRRHLTSIRSKQSAHSDTNVELLENTIISDKPINPALAPSFRHPLWGKPSK